MSFAPKKPRKRPKGRTRNDGNRSRSGGNAFDGNAVVFAAAKHETLDDKYAELTPELKKYYDEIVVYAASVEKSKRIKNARYEEYKVGSNRIVRLTISARNRV
ncbi:MAG: hypothetical protein ACLUSP_06350 [Christensenellales bacterium]